MNECRLGELETYCFMVDRGKPAACMALKDHELEEAVDVVIREKLNYLVEDLAEGWKTFWIFKRPFIKEVIKRAPEKPETVVDHWYLGKLFGYGDDEIERYSIRFGLFDLDECGIVTLRTRGEGVGGVIETDDESVLRAPIPSLPGFFSRFIHLITSFLSSIVTVASAKIIRPGDDKTFLDHGIRHGSGGRR